MPAEVAEISTATATPTGISEELWLGATAGLSALSATDSFTTSSETATSLVSDFLDTLTTSKPSKITAARRYKMWSSGDTQTLMRMVSEKQPWHEISVACGHPESGCRDKYLRLAGLSAIGYRRFSGAGVGRKPNWKPEEIQMLVRMVHEYRSWDEIQAACNHSKGACRSKYIRQTGKNPPLLTGWPSKAKHTQSRRQILSSMYADMEQSPPAPPQLPPPTPSPIESQPPPTPPQQPQPIESQPPPPPPQPIESQQPPTPPQPSESQPPPQQPQPIESQPPSYPRPQPLPPKPLPHQQQFVVNVNTLATKMCTKLDPKAMQLCNAMFQFLMMAMPEESATSS